MKRISAILFLTIYLFSTTELYQFAKIPMLVSHYIDHRQENKEMGLLEFISIHYLDGTKLDHDYESDMQLPFKSHDNFVIFTMPAVVSESIASIEMQVTYIEDRRSPLFSDDFQATPFYASIWQPPRFV